MTTKSAATVPALRHVTALVAANAEERHVLLRRAVLIRHGETEWTLNGRHTGSTDIPLTENGRDAARQLAPLAAQARFSLVLTSPMRRARRDVRAGRPRQPGGDRRQSARVELRRVRGAHGAGDLRAAARMAGVHRWLPGRGKPRRRGGARGPRDRPYPERGRRRRAVRARPRVQGLRRAMARPAACSRQSTSCSIRPRSAC